MIVLAPLLIFNWLWWRWTCRRWQGSALIGLCAAVFAVALIAGFLEFVTWRRLGFTPRLPRLWTATAFLWHVIILPALGVVWLATRAIGQVACRPAKCTAPGGTEQEPDDNLMTSRREVLIRVLAAAPPVIGMAASGVELQRLTNLRIRRLDVPVAGLPRALEGLRIAHITDVHVGKFTGQDRLNAIVHGSNELDPDLVLFTGDLVDGSLVNLPPGLEMLRRLRSRHGLFLCEGNHDAAQDRRRFAVEVHRAGLPLLRHNTRIIQIRGQRVQILGQRYSPSELGDEQRLRPDLERLLPMLRADAFPILLAHHPHAFDPASDAGLPLVFSGHTHGGQIMLTSNLGIGPLRFRYISGLYRRKRSSLVVANGAGDWLPLRVNAPAEIILATLRRDETGHEQ